MLLAIPEAYSNLVIEDAVGSESPCRIEAKAEDLANISTPLADMLTRHEKRTAQPCPSDKDQFLRQE